MNLLLLQGQEAQGVPVLQGPDQFNCGNFCLSFWQTRPAKALFHGPVMVGSSSSQTLMRSQDDGEFVKINPKWITRNWVADFDTITTRTLSTKQLANDTFIALFVTCRAYWGKDFDVYCHFLDFSIFRLPLHHFTLSHHCATAIYCVATDSTKLKSPMMQERKLTMGSVRTDWEHGNSWAFTCHPNPL